MTTAPPLRRNSAFTLVELFAVMAITAILAGLLVGAAGKARNSGDRASVLSAMRQLSLAIGAYAADNGGKLPGPLWVGQSPWYRKSDDRTLGFRLWSYLGAPEPEWFSQEATILSFPPYVRQRTGSGSPSVLLNNSVRVAGGNFRNPWGYRDAQQDTPPLGAMTIAQPSTTYMMEDVDATNTNVVAGTTWAWQLPPKPILGDARCRIYFDGSARLERIP